MVGGAVVTENGTSYQLSSLPTAASIRKQASSAERESSSVVRSASSLKVKPLDDFASDAASAFGTALQDSTSNYPFLTTFFSDLSSGGILAGTIGLLGVTASTPAVTAIATIAGVTFLVLTVIQTNIDIVNSEVSGGITNSQGTVNSEETSTLAYNADEPVPPPLTGFRAGVGYYSGSMTPATNDEETLSMAFTVDAGGNITGTIDILSGIYTMSGTLTGTSFNASATNDGFMRATFQGSMSADGSEISGNATDYGIDTINGTPTGPFLVTGYYNT